MKWELHNLEQEVRIVEHMSSLDLIKGTHGCRRTRKEYRN